MQEDPKSLRAPPQIWGSHLSAQPHLFNKWEEGRARFFW